MRPASKPHAALVGILLLYEALSLRWLMASFTLIGAMLLARLLIQLSR